MEIISRSAAKALGQKRYFTGRPCYQGHVDERYVSTHGCVSCVKAQTAAYYADNREDCLARSAVNQAANVTGSRAKSLRWRAANLDKARTDSLNRQRVRRYGVTAEQVEAMRLAQAGNCPGCAKPLDHAGTHHLDHCHTTGKVRGLLCKPCNLALGHVQDDPATLRRLAGYLEGQKLTE